MDGNSQQCRKAVRESAEQEEREREDSDRNLERALSSPKTASGYVSDEAEGLMEDWGLLQPPQSGLGTVEKWITKAGFEIKRGRQEFNFRASGDSLHVEVVREDGLTQEFRVKKDGSVEFVGTHKLVPLSSILTQEFHDRNAWIGKLRIREQDHQLVGLLRNLRVKGIVLRDIRSSVDNIIGVYKEGALLTFAN